MATPAPQRSPGLHIKFQIKFHSIDHDVLYNYCQARSSYHRDHGLLPGIHHPWHDHRRNGPGLPNECVPVGSAVQ